MLSPLTLPRRHLVAFDPRDLPHHFTDVLIIGGGLAGLRAALGVAEPLRALVVTKDEVRESNSAYAQGGIAGVLDPEDHFEDHIADTLAAGKDLYAEKTMTWSIPEADKCLAAAKESNRVVQIGLQHQSSGSLIDAKQWIKEGWLGKVTHVESWLSRNTPHGKGQWVRPVPSDCTAQNVNWKAFLNGRPDRPFDPYRLINWRLFWEFSGGNVAENMVHQIAWIMRALDLPLPSSAYMSGGVFSEKDGREVPDTIAVTLDFPTDIVVTWQSTFSNKHYDLGDRILGSDGTFEHHLEEPLQYWPEKTNRPSGEAVRGKTQGPGHMANWIECVRTCATPNAPAEIGYRSAIAVHMANLSYKRKQRITLEEARAVTPEYA